MKKTMKSVTKSSILTIATLSTLAIGLTFCQSIQAQSIENEQSTQSLVAETSSLPAGEQMEITFGKPTFQEEIRFDEWIKGALQTTNSNEQNNQSLVNATSKIPLYEAIEIIYGEPILQEEVEFDKPINVLEQVMSLNEQQLEKYNWQLKNAVDSQSKTIIGFTKNPEPVVLDFTNNQIKGGRYKRIGFSVGCNSMSGNYQLKDNQLSVNAVMSTRMYCEELDVAESMLAKMMKGNSTLSLENDTLSQTTTNGSILTWEGTLNN